MILLMGLPDEPPMAQLIQALERTHTHFFLIDQRRHAHFSVTLQNTTNGAVQGTLRQCNGDTLALTSVTAIYQRLHSAESFAEFDTLTPQHPARLHFNQFLEQLTVFSDFCEARVINRCRAMASNNSKPYQAQLIAACGLETPRTLITNNPARAKEFVHTCRDAGHKVIYKSASAVRSIVQTFTDNDFDRLQQIKLCPVQFQRYVPGYDVRVHTVGQNVFASKIESSSVDYRYAHQTTGEVAKLTSYQLPDAISEKCVNLAKALDLPLAGIDLRRTPDHQWFCFEVNPSPAYSYYETNTGQPISQAMAHYLSGS